MEYRQLEYFLKICETGSISRAAAKLYLSPQALSKSIDNLEQDLGLPLFYRTTHGLTLTQYGEVLREEGENLLRHHNSILAKLNSMQNKYMQSISIGFFSGMPTEFPTHFFEDFIAHHKDTEFHFYSYYDNEHNRKYMNMDVDLFFSSNRINRPDMTLLYESHRPFYVLLGEKHPLAHKESLHFSDLCNEYVISINSDFDCRDHLHKALLENNVPIQALLSNADLDLTSFLIRDHKAVSFFAGPQFMVPEGIVRIPIQNCTLTYNSYTYKRSGQIPHTAYELAQKIDQFRHLD